LRRAAVLQTKREDGSGQVGWVSVATGNAIYRDVVRRLPITVPMLDLAALDRAIADLGATPETVTDAQMQHALRHAIFPILGGDASGLKVPPARAGLITTDHANRVRSITPVAATLVGLPPEIDALGQPVTLLAELNGCVPLIAAFHDDAEIRVEERVIATDGRRVQCISNLRVASDGTILGVNTTVQDITLQKAMYTQVGQLYQASEARVRELSALAEIARIVAVADSLEATLAAIAERTTELIGCRAAGIYLPDASGTLRLMGQYGLPDGYGELITALMHDLAGLGVDVRTPTTMAFADGVTYFEPMSAIPPEAPASAQEARAVAAENGWASILAVPLMVQGTPIGTLTCYLALEESPPQETMNLVATIADQAAIAVRNSTLYAETQRQLAETTALHEIARVLSSSLDRSVVLQTIVEQAARVTGARVCGLLELTEDREGMLFRASYGHSEIPMPHEPLVQRGPAFHAMKTGQPVVIRSREEVARASWWRPEWVDRLKMLPYKGFIAMPFGYQGELNATLMLVYDRPIDPTEGDLQLIATFAEHAGVAMHNADLYEQAQQAAALEERNRLARDLHDSVTQSLFSMSLLAQVLPALWETQPEEARKSLDELRRLTRESLAEMRALLFQLRPVALEEDGLLEALAKHVESLQRRDGPRLTLATDRVGQRLPLKTEEALFRVATEAIGNALKHARAQAIDISLRTHDGKVTLTVRDDGRGFDPARQRSEPGHLGLAGMRERVARGNGIVTIESAPGAGTTVTATLPVPS
jgi:signal transduction histidine kinase